MYWTVAIFTLAAVGGMALALSLTQIFKGHDIRGEVGSNPDMKRLGLECPAHEKPERARECGDCTKCDKLR